MIFNYPETQQILIQYLEIIVFQYIFYNRGISQLRMKINREQKKTYSKRKQIISRTPNNGLLQNPRIHSAIAQLNHRSKTLHVDLEDENFNKQNTCCEQKQSFRTFVKTRRTYRVSKERQIYINFKQEMQNLFQILQKNENFLDQTWVLKAKQNIMLSFFNNFIQKLSQRNLDQAQILVLVWNNLFLMIEKAVEKICYFSKLNQKTNLTEQIDTHQKYQKLFMTYKKQRQEMKQQAQKRENFSKILVAKLRQYKRSVKKMEQTLRIASQKLNQFRNGYLQIQIQCINLTMQLKNIGQQSAKQMINRKMALVMQRSKQYKILPSKKKAKMQAKLSPICSTSLQNQKIKQQFYESFKCNFKQQPENLNKIVGRVIEAILDNEQSSPVDYEIFKQKLIQKYEQQTKIDQETDMQGFQIETADKKVGINAQQRFVNQMTKIRGVQTQAEEKPVPPQTISSGCQCDFKFLKLNRCGIRRTWDMSFLFENTLKSSKIYRDQKMLKSSLNFHNYHGLQPQKPKKKIVQKSPSPSPQKQNTTLIQNQTIYQSEQQQVKDVVPSKILQQSQSQLKQNQDLKPFEFKRKLRKIATTYTNKVSFMNKNFLEQRNQYEKQKQKQNQKLKGKQKQKQIQKPLQSKQNQKQRQRQKQGLREKQKQNQKSILASQKFISENISKQTSFHLIKDEESQKQKIQSKKYLVKERSVQTMKKIRDDEFTSVISQKQQKQQQKETNLKFRKGHKTNRKGSLGKVQTIKKNTSQSKKQKFRTKKSLIMKHVTISSRAQFDRQYSNPKKEETLKQIHTNNNRGNKSIHIQVNQIEIYKQISLQIQKLKQAPIYTRKKPNKIKNLCKIVDSVFQSACKQYQRRQTCKDFLFYLYEAINSSFGVANTKYIYKKIIQFVKQVFQQKQHSKQLSLFILMLGLNQEGEQNAEHTNLNNQLIIRISKKISYNWRYPLKLSQLVLNSQNVQQVIQKQLEQSNFCNNFNTQLINHLHEMGIIYSQGLQISNVLAAILKFIIDKQNIIAISYEPIINLIQEPDRNVISSQIVQFLIQLHFLTAQENKIMLNRFNSFFQNQQQISKKLFPYFCCQAGILDFSRLFHRGLTIFKLKQNDKVLQSITVDRLKKKNSLKNKNEIISMMLENCQKINQSNALFHSRIKKNLLTLLYLRFQQCYSKRVLDDIMGKDLKILYNQSLIYLA